MFVKPHDVSPLLLFPEVMRCKKELFTPNLISVCTLRQSSGGTLCGWFHTHKIDLKYVQIRLEMLTSTYILVKSVEMNSFHVNNRRGALCLSQGRRMGYPAGTWRLKRLKIDSLFGTMFWLITKTPPCITGPLWRGIHQWPVDSPHKGPVVNADRKCRRNLSRTRWVDGTPTTEVTWSLSGRWSWSWMTYCHTLCAMSIGPPILR